MDFVSTRDREYRKVTASKAIADGLASDGGLYVPCAFPALHGFIGASCERIALDVLSLYLTDFGEDELKEYISLAYGHCLPVAVNGRYLELFHGKTAAFKDVALHLFPYVLKASLRKQHINQTAVILTATSGDTGSAVLAGVKNVPGMRAVVFYPVDGVSKLQKLQMTAQEGDNINVYGIRGNFDDAQRAVKAIFSDEQFRAKYADRYLFTSANSINIGRLLPQITYYFYAYSQSVCTGTVREGDSMNFVVPTGNFGNILAGYYARKMGLPIHKLICATNTNNVLYDFIGTGVYNTKRAFQTTVSPSMDILISSNLERLLYDTGGYETVISACRSLESTGEFSADVPLPAFDTEFVTDSETVQTIAEVYRSDSYIIDPHTAVAQCACNKYRQRTGDGTYTVIVATASPYKFPETVSKALGNVLFDPPPCLKSLEDRPVLHGEVTDDIRQTIEKILQ